MFKSWDKITGAEARRIEALRLSVSLWGKVVEQMDLTSKDLDIGKEIINTAEQFVDWMKK